MKKSRMIPNEEKINKRALESRRISAIVVIVVIVFLIPEVPHMIFLIVFMSRHHTDASTSLHTNRTVTCVYELLVICTFNANFWIYLAMNRKFRERLRLLSRAFVDPVYSLVRRIKTTHNFVQQPRIVASSVERPNVVSSRRCHSAPTNMTRRTSRSSSRSSRRGSVQFELRMFPGNQTRNNGIVVQPAQNFNDSDGINIRMVPNRHGNGQITIAFGKKRKLSPSYRKIPNDLYN